MTIVGPVGRCRGAVPRSKTSMMIMRPPQLVSKWNAPPPAGRAPDGERDKAARPAIRKHPAIREHEAATSRDRAAKFKQDQHETSEPVNIQKPQFDSAVCITNHPLARRIEAGMRAPNRTLRGGAGGLTARPAPVFAPSLHYLQVLSAFKAVSADACVGCAAPITFMLPPAAGWTLTTSHFIVAVS